MDEVINEVINYNIPEKIIITKQELNNRILYKYIPNLIENTSDGIEDKNYNQKIFDVSFYIDEEDLIHFKQFKFISTISDFIKRHYPDIMYIDNVEYDGEKIHLYLGVSHG